MIIPLRSNAPHQRFTVELDGVRLRIRLDWLIRGEYFTVQIERDGEVIAAGRGLHPEIDLLQGLRLGIGRLYLQGNAPTPQTLGVTSELRYDS